MALDFGHAETDKKLKALEKKLAKEYQTALTDMKEKTKKYFERFEKQDAEMLRKLKANAITEKEYLKWRQNHMLTGERYKNFVNSLATDLTHTNEIAMSMLDPSLKEAYADNFNYGGYEIAKGLNQNISWDLADHDTVERLIKDNPRLLPKPRVDIPKDKLWNQQKLTSALAQGILQGESINHIADRLQTVTDMSRSAAIRNARTMTTGAENAGRLASYEEAENMGIQTQKEWLSTLDNRTRETHIIMDREVVDNDKPFSNKLMYPGDPNGAPEEVYNCRCTMICKVKKRDYRMDTRANKLGDMTYQQWKDQYTHGALIGKTGANYDYQSTRAMQKIIQNAPDDVRDLWKSAQDEFNETQKLKGSRAFYRSGENNVYLDAKYVSVGDDLNPSFEVHFHEYGHNIDYVAGHGIPISLSYRDAQGRSFEQIIMDEWDKKFDVPLEDVVLKNFNGNLDLQAGGMGGQSWLRSSINDWQRSNKIPRDDERYVLLKETAMSFSESDVAGMTSFIKKNIDIFKASDYAFELKEAKKSKILNYCETVKKTYDLKTRGNLSDMMERYTVKNVNIAYPLGAGHGKSYASEDGRLGKEAFAEMFSSEVCNKPSLELIKKELPEAYSAFKKIVGGALK